MFYLLAPKLGDLQGQIFSDDQQKSSFFRPEILAKTPGFLKALPGQPSWWQKMENVQEHSVTVKDQLAP